MTGTIYSILSCNQKYRYYDWRVQYLSLFEPQLCIVEIFCALYFKHEQILKWKKINISNLWSFINESWLIFSNSKENGQSWESVNRIMRCLLNKTFKNSQVSIFSYMSLSLCSRRNKVTLKDVALCLLPNSTDLYFLEKFIFKGISMITGRQI